MNHFGFRARLGPGIRSHRAQLLELYHQCMIIVALADLFLYTLSNG